MTGRQAFEERFGFRARGEFRVCGIFEIPLTVMALLLMAGGSVALIVVMANPETAFGGTFGALPCNSYLGNAVLVARPDSPQRSHLPLRG